MMFNLQSHGCCMAGSLVFNMKIFPGKLSVYTHNCPGCDINISKANLGNGTRELGQTGTN